MVGHCWVRASPSPWLDPGLLDLLGVLGSGGVLAEPRVTGQGAGGFVGWGRRLATPLLFWEEVVRVGPRSWNGI